MEVRTTSVIAFGKMVSNENEYHHQVYYHHHHQHHHQNDDHKYESQQLYSNQIENHVQRRHHQRSPTSSLCSLSSPTTTNPNPGSSSFSEGDFESNYHIMSTNIDLESSSPLSNVDNDENIQQMSRRGGGGGGSHVRRGRPKLESITSLIMSGANSASPIRCNVCKRVFPREKSLQAHMRTHTGERPYSCDYPGCERRFTQSGQLRTHQRLHTGEKPFICAFKGCKNRFTHANRHCSLHPESGVQRDKAGSTPSVLKVNTTIENASEDVIRWIEKYSQTEKRSGIKRGRPSSLGAADRLRARNFARELDEIALEEEEDQEDADQEDLVLMEPVCKKKRAALEYKRSISIPTEDENSLDTNLIQEPVITKDKLMGALALMELAGSSMSDPLWSNSSTGLTDIGSEIVIANEASTLVKGSVAVVGPPLSSGNGENKTIYLTL